MTVLGLGSSLLVIIIIIRRRRRRRRRIWRIGGISVVSKNHEND